MTKPNPIRVIARHKRAVFDYEILDRYEAGLVLVGSEVKSLRGGKATISEAYIKIDRDGQAWLQGANIPEYSQANINNHDTTRPRKLLLSKRELSKLRRQVQEKGLTLVPIALYFKGAWVKLEFGLGRGKKLHDKRATLKEKQTKRELRRIR